MIRLISACFAMALFSISSLPSFSVADDTLATGAYDSPTVNQQYTSGDTISATLDITDGTGGKKVNMSTYKFNMVDEIGNDCGSLNTVTTTKDPTTGNYKISGSITAPSASKKTKYFIRFEVESNDTTQDYGFSQSIYVSPKSAGPGGS